MTSPERRLRLTPLPDAEWNDRCRTALVDLIFTIGGYLLLAMAVNTFGVQNEHR